jgi:hypothetical protein
MARYLIGKHGAAARKLAEKRARQLDESGEKGAAAVWSESADEVERLLRHP